MGDAEKAGEAAAEQCDDGTDEGHRVARGGQRADHHDDGPQQQRDGGQRDQGDLGSGRIVVSKKEVPNLIVNMV